MKLLLNDHNVALALRWALVHGKATPDAIEQHELDCRNIANSLHPGQDAYIDAFLKACGVGELSADRSYEIALRADLNQR